MVGDCSEATNVTDEKRILFMRNEDAARKVVVCSIKTGDRPGTKDDE